MERVNLCNVCGYTFDCNKKFYDHHCRKEKVKCDECQKEFLTKFILDRHIQTIHAKKIYSCEQCNVSVNWTPKAHQISDHFSDYFEDPLVKKQALGVTSDQIIEHMHSYINRMLTRSIYKLKLANTEKSAKRQHSGILKINAFATKIKK